MLTFHSARHQTGVNIAVYTVRYEDVPLFYE